MQSQLYNTFIRRHLPRSLSISSSLVCSVGKTSLWCRAKNRTQACLTSSRRATNWATPHHRKIVPQFSVVLRHFFVSVSNSWPDLTASLVKKFRPLGFMNIIAEYNSLVLCRSLTPHLSSLPSFCVCVALPEYFSVALSLLNLLEKSLSHSKTRD